MEPLDLIIDGTTLRLRPDPITPGGACATIDNPGWIVMAEAKMLIELMGAINVVVHDINVTRGRAVVFFDAVDLDEDKREALEEALARLVAPPTPDQ